MKFILFILVIFIVLFSLTSFYVGYKMGKTSQQTIPTTVLNQRPLLFTPPIPLNETTLQSAHMTYTLTAILGDVTTENSDLYLTLYRPDNSLIKKIKLTPSVMIYSGIDHGKKKLSDLKKGQKAQINITYEAYRGGQGNTYITYILIK